MSEEHFTAAGRISAEETERANQDSALSARVSDLETKMGAANGEWSMDQWMADAENRLTGMSETLKRVEEMAQTAAKQGYAYSLADAQFRRDVLKLMPDLEGTRPSMVKAYLAAADNMLAWMKGEAPVEEVQGQAPTLEQMLPRGLVESLKAAPAERIAVIQYLLRERTSHEDRHGYDADHDDLHDRGELAYQAALALIDPLAVQTLAPEHLRNLSQWIEPGQERPVELIQAIALAAAELERIIRRDRRAADDFATGATPPDRLPPAAAAPVIDQPAPAANARPVLTLGDLDDMHHALGRPSHPLHRTSRNYFASYVGSEENERFMSLPDFWELSPHHGEQNGRVWHVTIAGRRAVANAMMERPDIWNSRERVNNAGEPVYVGAPTDALGKEL